MSNWDKEKKKKINQVAVDVMERIHAENLVPTPEIYHLWYAYYTSGNMDLVRAIDLFVANDQKIEHDSCIELYQRFLSDQREDNTVREAGDKIQETIKDMSGVFEDVRTRTEKYGENISTLTENLNEDSDPAEVRNVLSNVLSDTQEMLEQNQQLENQLSQSSQAMEELKRDLETVRKEALTDGLTQLANRKAFDSEIKRTIHKTIEDETVFSLVFLDIDHFKPFNDTYGHQVGDQVLRLVARTLKDGVKGKDMVARYGGEEFVIILPETTMVGGNRVAESLLKAVASKEVINRNTGNKLGRITLSAGVAQYNAGESIEDIIRRADEALYHAKQNGRNRVACAPDGDEKKVAT